MPCRRAIAYGRMTMYGGVFITYASMPAYLPALSRLTTVLQRRWLCRRCLLPSLIPGSRAVARLCFITALHTCCLPSLPVPSLTIGRFSLHTVLGHGEARTGCYFACLLTYAYPSVPTCHHPALLPACGLSTSSLQTTPHARSPAFVVWRFLVFPLRFA